MQLQNLLKQQLTTKKPGIKAQELMMPEGRLTISEHDAPPTSSAVLIALYINRGKAYFPLIRRTTYNGMHSGQMALPGGKFDKTDKNLTETAIREAYEEVGIEKSDVDVLGTLSKLHIPVTNMEITPVVGFMENMPDYTLNRHEVDGVFQISLGSLLQASKKHNEVWSLRGKNIKVPFYLLQNQKVWGATAMILSELEQLVCSLPLNMGTNPLFNV